MMEKHKFRFPIPLEKEEIGNQKSREKKVSIKQLIANQQNAKISTGPVTIQGKEIVAKNAIKHGIFTKDLLIGAGAANENLVEYEELLDKLMECLLPRNQIESLLVEKIAVDFWRLRRTIRFEAGSISKHIEQLIKSGYSERSDNDTLDREIEYAEKRIRWNTAYLKHLRKNEVTFDQPTWESKSILSDIVEDFRLIARGLSNLTAAEHNSLYKEEGTFKSLSELLARHGYSQDEQIATRLIEIYVEENQKLNREIESLQKRKVGNQVEDLRNEMIGSVPEGEDAEKAMKYERSIQKSIFQNLFLLKKLQGLF